MPTTALIVAVPEAEALVGELRREFHPNSAQGVPPHVTVLVPFIESTLLQDTDLNRLRAMFARIAAFPYTFGTIGRFKDTTYLSPEDPSPFVHLTHEVCAAYPSYPPYGGAHEGIVPHLTVAHGSQRVAEAAAAKLLPWVTSGRPIVGRCGGVQLLEQQASGWQVRHVFKLSKSDA